jgi:cytochrome c553
MKAINLSRNTVIASVVFAIMLTSALVYSGDRSNQINQGNHGHQGNQGNQGDQGKPNTSSKQNGDAVIENAVAMVTEGRNIFRYDTYGDQVFWGDTLQFHQALNQLSPRQALALGLKVDAEALPAALAEKVRKGKIDLDDPAVTLELIRRDAVLGVVGFFDGSQKLQSVGLTCAVCHSTVNDSVAPSIGQRLDGWANHDLNAGAIIAAAPNIKPLTDLLAIVHPGITDEQVRSVLNSWGPGKFDAELILDGKAFQPDNHSAATLIPNAFALGGHNLHTWTGGWGTITYWNAFVANLELHGIGNFLDARLDNAAQFPIAAAARLGHITVDEEQDQITSKLPALAFYQLALPAPKPQAGVDFARAAARRGEELFNTKAQCGRCHHEPIWTEPGWNTHSPAEMRIDSFQADRSPDHSYRTMNLAAVFVRERGLFMKPENKGRFYHDGRFQTLLDVVQSYDARFSLGLTPSEMSDLVEYLKSL